MLTGDNSILGKAQSTHAYNAIGKAKDEVNLAYNSAMTEYLRLKYDDGATPKTIDSIFKTEISELNTKLSSINSSTGTTTVKYKGKKVTVKYTDLQSGKTYTTTATLDSTLGSEKLSTWTAIVEGDAGQDTGDAVVAGVMVEETEKDNYTDPTTKKTATIPAGFTVSGIESEQNIDKGLVIYLIPDGEEVDWTKKATNSTTLTAEQKAAFNESATGDNVVYEVQAKYDQFVWIPVDQTNKPMYKESTAEGYVSTDPNKKNYEGVLYFTFDKTANSGQMSNYGQGATNRYREPDTVSSYDGTASYLSVISTITGDSTSYTNITKFQETMQKDYNDMVKSVQEYKGFWIGRYEASLVGGKTRVIAGQTSIKNTDTATESTKNMWYGLYARQKNFAKDAGKASTIQSGMIWGSQYDAMLNWMVANNVTVSSTTPSGKSKNTSRITGATKYTKDETTETFNDKIQNIYDILGNSREWTAEAYRTDGRAYRGGCYDDNYAPRNRTYGNAFFASYDYYGSRPYFIMSRSGS